MPDAAGASGTPDPTEAHPTYPTHQAHPTYPTSEATRPTRRTRPVYSPAPFNARAVKLSFPSFTATRNATSELPSALSLVT